jgi:hypothetical protein
MGINWVKGGMGLVASIRPFAFHGCVVASKDVRSWSTTSRLSLYPLPFNEAVADILKVKPGPKSPKSRAKRKAKPRKAK